LRQRRLLVDPLLWTSHHLEVVGCRFRDTCALPAEDPGDGIAYHRSVEQDSGEHCESFEAERLAKSCAPRVKYFSLVNILGSLLEKIW
jgi:hypothetical protein